VTQALVDRLLQETARDSQHANMTFAGWWRWPKRRASRASTYTTRAARNMAAIEFQTQYLGRNKTAPPEERKSNLHPAWQSSHELGDIDARRCRRE
jgi:hypothetical protein